MQKTIILLSLFGLLLLPASSFAQVDKTPEPINSYELFWPMVAGKTEGDPLYFLKRLKETVRGWFIFGAVQKADYAVFLGTKRVLEAEKLLKEGKNDLAEKSLSSALKEFSFAERQIDSVLSKGESLGEVAQTMSNRVDNLKRLVAWLSVTNEQAKTKLREVSDKLNSLSSKL